MRSLIYGLWQIHDIMQSALCVVSTKSFHRTFRYGLHRHYQMSIERVYMFDIVLESHHQCPLEAVSMCTCKVGDNADTHWKYYIVILTIQDAFRNI